jgi:hypothetical protein
MSPNPLFDALKDEFEKISAFDGWNPSSGAIMSHQGGTRAINQVGGRTALSSPVTSVKPKFDANALKAAYSKAGIAPPLRSAAKMAVRAI